MQRWDISGSFRVNMQVSRKDLGDTEAIEMLLISVWMKNSLPIALFLLNGIWPKWWQSRYCCRCMLSSVFLLFRTDWTHISSSSGKDLSIKQPKFLCQRLRENTETKGMAGHLLGNRAWAWDVRTNLWDIKLGWMAWLEARVGLGTCVIPGWLMGVIAPTSVPAKVWPTATGAAPSTCCPMPLFPEEATEEAAELLLLTGGAWALCVVVPVAVKYKAVRYGTLQ